MHVVNYTAFRDDFHVQEDESELHLLEKFHAARILSQNGNLETFVDPVLVDPEKHSQRLTADLAGVEELCRVVVVADEEGAEPAPGPELPPGPPTPPDMDLVMKTAAEYGLEILGPPGIPA